MYLLLAQTLVATLLSGPVAVAPAAPASCIADHQPASIAKPVIPEAPLMAQLEHLTGTTVVRVDLSDTGSVVRSSVARSSGSVILDRAAVQTAKAMAYAPETLACTPISGSYNIEVHFAD